MCAYVRATCGGVLACVWVDGSACIGACNLSTLLAKTSMLKPSACHHRVPPGIASPECSGSRTDGVPKARKFSPKTGRGSSKHNKISADGLRLHQSETDLLGLKSCCPPSWKRIWFFWPTGPSFIKVGNLWYHRISPIYLQTRVLTQ